jgi:hypothetical protein
MDRVEEIEAAIDRLPPDEFRRIARWLLDRDQARWDDRLDADSAAGGLDFLFDGTASDWPPAK